MEQKCLKCGYEWESRVEMPKQCPACGSPYWMQPAKKRKAKVVLLLDRGQYLSLQMRAEKKGVPMVDYVIGELFRER